MSLLVSLGLSVFLTVSAAAQGDDRDSGKIPPGMEIIQVTQGNRLLVPEGTRTQRAGSMLTREFTEEYAARRFGENEERFKKIEAHIGLLEAEIEELKKILSKLQETTSPTVKEKSE